MDLLRGSSSQRVRYSMNAAAHAVHVPADQAPPRIAHGSSTSSPAALSFTRRHPPWRVISLKKPVCWLQPWTAMCEFPTTSRRLVGGRNFMTIEPDDEGNPAQHLWVNWWIENEAEPSSKVIHPVS
jgi:hypothetical protein